MLRQHRIYQLILKLHITSERNVEICVTGYLKTIVRRLYPHHQTARNSTSGNISVCPALSTSDGNGAIVCFIR